jgi:hypothetical protein
MEACNEDTNSVSLLAPTDNDRTFGGKDCVMSVVDKVNKSKPKEVIRKKSIEDENKNETNCSNVSSEIFNDDGKEESDDDSTIEENDAMSGFNDSKHHVIRDMILPSFSTEGQVIQHFCQAQVHQWFAPFLE